MASDISSLREQGLRLKYTPIPLEGDLYLNQGADKLRASSTTILTLDCVTCIHVEGAVEWFQPEHLPAWKSPIQTKGTSKAKWGHSFSLYFGVKFFISEISLNV